MKKMIRHSKLFLKRNSSTILTCVGGIGVVATTVLAINATTKASKLLEKVEEEKGEDLTKIEIVKNAAPLYIPMAITGVSTLACIFGANMLSKRQQAALISAYALLDRSYKDYKHKVQELYGEAADIRVKEETAKDNYEEDKYELEDNQQLFYDEYSKRYFESTIEHVQNAEYQINRDLSMREYATLNEFYEYLGIEPIDGGDELGWSSGMNFDYYWQTWIDFGHQKVVMDDGLECYIITMFEEPNVGWDDYA